MRTHAKITLVSVAVLILTVGLPAITVVDANLAQIVEHTDKAFVGTVTGVEVVQVNGDQWASQITVSVSQGVLGGAAAGETVTWTQARPNEHTPYCGMPQYQVGGEHLVFLSATAGDSPFSAPVALGHGSFRCETNANGVTTATNAFGNGALFSGLDLAAISAASDGPVSANGVEGIINAAQTLAASPNPAEAYAASGDAGLAATPTNP